MKRLKKVRILNDVSANTHTEKTVGQDQWKAHHAVEHQCPIGVIDVFRGQLALDLCLVGAVVRHIEEQATQKHWPESVLTVGRQTQAAEVDGLKSDK